MSWFIILVDIVGLALTVAGFLMAFRQDLVRALFGWKPVSREATEQEEDAGDPLTYVLRIAGVMVMVFGFVLAAMMTAFHLLQ